MLLAGKSGGKHGDQSLQTRKINVIAGSALTVTFSFDKQDGGVSVGGRLHLSNQSFFLFLFLFFRLQTQTVNQHLSCTAHMIKLWDGGDTPITF